MLPGEFDVAGVKSARLLIEMSQVFVVDNDIVRTPQALLAGNLRFYNCSYLLFRIVVSSHNALHLQFYRDVHD